jgi:hypothetical protein
MNQLTLSTLLNELGSDKVTGFFLVLARVSPLFVLAPLGFFACAFGFLYACARLGGGSQ